MYVSPLEITEDKINQLKRESADNLKVIGGETYESKAINSIGHRIANSMKTCTSYLDGRSLPDFSYFVRIDNDGNIIESTAYPVMALSNCFSGLMSGVKYPEHLFKVFLLHIEMRVKI